MLAFVGPSVFSALVLAAVQQPAVPVPQASAAPSLADASAWIAAHLPSRYDENLAGTTNTIDAHYSAKGCDITVTLGFSWQFNSLRDSDRSAAFSVRGNAAAGHHFDVSDDGGTIDFSIVDPSSLRISDATEYLGTEQITPGSFEFTFRNEADAKAMLDAMASFTRACSSYRS